MYIRQKQKFKKSYIREDIPVFNKYSGYKYVTIYSYIYSQ